MSLSALLPLTSATVAGACWWWVVPSLPQPEDDLPVPRFDELRSRRLATTSAALGGAAATVALTAPANAWPLLAAAAGVGAPLALLDQLTTWLPRPLTTALWVSLLPGMVALLATTSNPLALAGHLAGAALATLAFFWLVWRLTGALGFGDVRLAPALALVGASVDPATGWATVLLGTVAGALWGLATTLWRRCHPHPLGPVFAYGPALWCGLWLALLVRH